MFHTLLIALPAIHKYLIKLNKDLSKKSPPNPFSSALVLQAVGLAE